MPGGTDAQRVAAFGDLAKSGKHFGAFQRVQNFVKALHQQIAFATRDQQHMRGAFQHAHQDAGRNAVAGDVGEISDPIPFGDHQVDQIAADFAAGLRIAVEGEALNLLIDFGNEDAMNFLGQCDFRVNAKVAFALLNSYEDKAGVADDHSDEDDHGVEIQAGAEHLQT